MATSCPLVIIEQTFSAHGCVCSWLLRARPMVASAA
jgi:hypothetical protein